MAREMKFAETLANLIQNRGYSRNHAEVARGVHVSPSAISQYLKGRSVPSFSTLIALADFLETDLDYLVFGEAPARALSPDPSPLARYIDRTLADLQARTAAHASLVGRIAEVLGAQIDDAARSVIGDGHVVAGMLDDEETYVLERYSVATRLHPMNLQYDVIIYDDGAEAPGRFLPVVVANLRVGRTYRFLLPSADNTWKPVVDKYRRLLREGGASDSDLKQCEFKEIESTMAVGYGIYQFDVRALREEHPLLFERIGHTITSDHLFGYTLPVSPDLKADAVMNEAHVERAAKMFDQQWNSRKAVTL